MRKRSASRLKIRDIAYIGASAALIAICSWISVPALVPFTLQTFAVFSVVGILGGRRGTIAVLVYLLLGAVGLPVFAGFRGGIGVLLGTTGGYIAGFLLAALLMWAAERLYKDSWFRLACAMAVGLFVCYLFGTLWFLLLYTRSVGRIALGAVLMKCVVPFLIPDALKIALAMLLTRRLRPLVPQYNASEKERMKVQPE